MRTGSFICSKVDGKLKIYDRAGFDAVLEHYGDGEDLQLHIEEVGRKRTAAQNRFFHGPILKAFESLGWRKQEAKDMLCLRFIPQECRQMDGSIVLVPGHTSSLTVEEYSDLIEQCIQLAAENEIIIQDADDWRRAHRVEPLPSDREMAVAYQRVSKVAGGR